MKPRLYLDIDGIVYAEYGGEWQVRPYVVTLTGWARHYFDIYWVSDNSNKENVVESIYAHGSVITDYWPRAADERGYQLPVHQDWHRLADHSHKLQAIQVTGGVQQGEWLLIEDTPPSAAQQEILNDYGMLDRYLVVPDTGSDVLLDLRFVLEGWLRDRKLVVPFDWVREYHPERDMCIQARWKGYGKQPRGPNGEIDSNDFHENGPPTNIVSGKPPVVKV